MTTMNKMVLNGTREDHKSALYPFFFFTILIGPCTLSYAIKCILIAILSEDYSKLLAPFGGVFLCLTSTDSSYIF